MSGRPRFQPRRGNNVLSLAIATLAFWQLRRTWFLLLFMTLGIVAAVVIACAIPLLSSVMTTAGVRGTVRATQGGTELELNTQTTGISTPVLQGVQQQFDPIFQQYLGNIIQPAQSAIINNDFSFSPTLKNAFLTVYATSLQQAAPHLGTLQGRLAQTTSNPGHELEVMMTPDTAKLLKLTIGSTFKLAFQYSIINSVDGVTTSPTRTAILTAHLVGLFNITSANTTYWHGEDFKTSQFGLEGSTVQSQYTILTSESALLSYFDALRQPYNTDAIHSGGYSGYELIWYYRLDTSRFSDSNLDALVNQFANIRATIDSQYGNIEGGGGNTSASTSPYLSFVSLSGPTLSTDGNPSILEQFQGRIAVARIPAGIFAILILTLVLFFVSLMTTLLVDRQTDTIAMLRSRGASGGQIFGALLLQCIVLSLIALLIGPPLAAWAVVIAAPHVLPATGIDALNIITHQPLQAMLGTGWYALAIIVAALITMALSLVFVARMDVLLLRRESARSNKRPLWQRLNLDIIAGVIALGGYGVSLYITSVGTLLQGDARVLIATPLSIIAPFFLVAGCLFLFLRVFPWILRLGARFSARGRGVVSLLAFAQIARAPRQSLRMVLLLALATTFALFTLVYNATEAQHIQQLVAYQAGADFSGDTVTNTATTTAAQIIKQYQSIPGVRSVSTGYTDQGFGGQANLAMEVRAVDAGSFAQTVIWPSQAAYEQARQLLTLLIKLRPTAKTPPSDIVPTIVDQTLLDKLHTHIGSFFTITLSNASPQTMQCFIVGVVGRIPTINTVVPTDNSTPIAAGGVLVDYQSYVDAYQQDVKKARANHQVLGPLQPPTLNTLWLHSGDDAASLASVRAALNSAKFRVSHIIDRRALLVTLQSDPLYLILNGVLSIGTVTALLLALVGDLLVSWLTARTRVMNFVTLRALGSSVSQVVSMLTWEQAIVSLTGLLLGGGFGALLITSVIPSLTFTDLNSNLSNTQLFALQSAVAANIVVPPILPFVLLLLIGIYALGLTIMVRVVSRPALTQMLRLNED